MAPGCSARGPALVRGAAITAREPVPVRVSGTTSAAVSQGAGIRDAALLVDDIGAAHDAALGAAHASLASTLLASMKARDPLARLWFVPTVYDGLAGGLAQAGLKVSFHVEVEMRAKAPAAGGAAAGQRAERQ